VIGLQFRSIVEHAQNVIVGCLLIGTGVGLVVYELVGPAHRHSHRHDHVHGPTGAAAIIVPFGAAASPDLTILPVFLAASTAGVAPAVGSLIVFAAVTITTIVGLTLFATLGGHQIRAGWLDRWGNLFTAAVLSAIGILILTGTL
jgi:hypothetical protein